MSDSDIDLAIKTSKRLERLLETRYGAEGRGLHEKLASVESMLSPEALGHGRYVATMRNKVVHEDGFSLPDRPRFLNRAAALEAALEKEVAGGRRSTAGVRFPWGAHGGGRGLTAGVRFPWGVVVCAAGFVLFVATVVPVPVKRMREVQVLVPGMAALLMIGIPPTLWVRGWLPWRLKGWLALLVLFSFAGSPPLALVYMLFELGRYVVGKLRGAA
jgi:hypothetical protein